MFLRSTEAKQRLVPSLTRSNVPKVLSAPVTAIIAYDEHFYARLPKLWPQNPSCKTLFEDAPEFAVSTAFRNSSLQGAYLIIAARSLGLDCGPMSGFDNNKVDEEFFSNQTLFERARIRSNFLCNLGYGDRRSLQPRNPRLDFDEACVLL